MPGLVSASAALSTQVNERKASAALIPLKPDGTKDGSGLRFQYWPASISDSKSVNWTPREVPGGSLPIYQWVSSGERLISFTAEFSCDMDLILGDRALVERIKALGLEDQNVDIRAAVAWLRQFQLPTQATVAGGFDIARAPARLRLVLPGTAIGLTGGLTGENGVDPDEISAVLLGCDVQQEGFFPSGLPRYASVGLSFGQCLNPGKTLQMPTASGMDKVISGELKTFGYKLAPLVVSSKP